MEGARTHIMVMFRVPRDMPDAKFEEMMEKLCAVSPALCARMKADRQEQKLRPTMPNGS